MKANELMIGDWYAFRGHPYKCTASDIASIAECEEKGAQTDISEIPITPEILEKNGFKMAKWKEDEPAGLLGKWWDNSGQVLVKRFYFTLLGEVYSVKANNSRISNIRYVHELQHALRLCGIDKEIEL